MDIFDFYFHVWRTSLYGEIVATVWDLMPKTFLCHLSVKPFYRMQEHKHSLKELRFLLHKAVNRLNKRGANMNQNKLVTFNRHLKQAVVL